MSAAARRDEEGADNHDRDDAQTQKKGHATATGGSRWVAWSRRVSGRRTVPLGLRVGRRLRVGRGLAVALGLRIRRWLPVAGSGGRWHGWRGRRRRRPCRSGGRGPSRLRRVKSAPANRAEPGADERWSAAVGTPYRALARVPSHKAPPLRRTAPGPDPPRQLTWHKGRCLRPSLAITGGPVTPVAHASACSRTRIPAPPRRGNRRLCRIARKRSRWHAGCPCGETEGPGVGGRTLGGTCVTQRDGPNRGGRWHDGRRGSEVS